MQRNVDRNIFFIFLTAYVLFAWSAVVFMRASEQCGPNGLMFTRRLSHRLTVGVICWKDRSTSSDVIATRLSTPGTCRYRTRWHHAKIEDSSEIIELLLLNARIDSTAGSSSRMTWTHRFLSSFWALSSGYRFLISFSCACPNSSRNWNFEQSMDGKRVTRCSGFPSWHSFWSARAEEWDEF